MERKKRNKKFALIICGILCLIIALFWWYRNVLEDKHSGTESTEIAEQLEVAMSEPKTDSNHAAPKPKQTKTPAPTEEPSGLPTEDEELEGTDPAEQLTVTMPEIADKIQIGDYWYIGILEIPQLGLTLPVMEEWTYEGLRRAPGRFSGGPDTNDFIICAHNYESHFGTLKYLQEGDEIKFTTCSGLAYRYTVSFVETRDPSDVEGMLDWDKGLTLFTCTIGGQYRVTVRAERNG